MERAYCAAPVVRHGITGGESRGGLAASMSGQRKSVETATPMGFNGSAGMPMNKPHLEFHKVDMSDGWITPPGYPAGIQQKVLASDLDETRKSGSRTRLLRFAPGVYTTAPFVHDHWEEVYLMSGDLIVGNDAQGRGGESFAAPTYACRPPGVHHGPFKSAGGCMLFEMHYYDESKQ
jgi:ChrR-like protein with cupin domain